MAIDMFMFIEGVEGETRSVELKGWIDVLAWSWGASNSIATAELPRLVRKAMKERRKEYLATKGFNLKGELLDQEKWSKMTDEEKEEEKERFDELLTLYTIDEKVTEKFDEPAPRVGRANVQDISWTKYIDRSSPNLMAMTLTQKQGINAILRIFKPCPKPRKPTPPKEEAKEEAKEADGEKKEDKEEEEEEEGEPETEPILVQEFKFTDVFITSVSTGGSGGEDRLTENVSMNFRSVEFSYIEHPRVKAAIEESQRQWRSGRGRYGNNNNNNRRLEPVPIPDTPIVAYKMKYDSLMNESECTTVTDSSSSSSSSSSL